MAIPGIGRERTELEEKDFIDIGDKTYKPEEAIRFDIIHKIVARNRWLITHCKDPVKIIKELSCQGCFKAEHKARITDDDFRENFNKYKGRKVLDLVKYRAIKHRFGDDKEYSIHLRFKPCPYCALNESIGFSNFEMEEKVFKELVKFANQSVIEGFDEKVEGEWGDEKEVGFPDDFKDSKTADNDEKETTETEVKTDKT